MLVPICFFKRQPKSCGQLKVGGRKWQAIRVWGGNKSPPVNCPLPAANASAGQNCLHAEAASMKHLSISGHVLSFMFLKGLVQGMGWIFDQTVSKAGFGKHKHQWRAFFYALGYIKLVC